METRQILISLHNKFNGNWDEIYDFISQKKFFAESDLDLTNSENLITILDSNYPDELKHHTRPPFVITKEQAQMKTFEITFKVIVEGLNEEIALDNAIDSVVDGNCDYKVKVLR